jgi:predicted nucleic acid-binding protein
LIYVDTSVLVALLTKEGAAPTVQHWYRRSSDKILVTSDWSLTEFSSALSLKERTKQLTAKQAKAICRTFDIFINGGVRLLEVSRQAFRHSANLIQSCSGLRAGDALHLAVVLEFGINELATLDKLLAEKAGQMGVSLVEF